MKGGVTCLCASKVGVYQPLGKAIDWAIRKKAWLGYLLLVTAGLFSSHWWFRAMQVSCSGPKYAFVHFEPYVSKSVIIWVQFLFNVIFPLGIHPLIKLFIQHSSIQLWVGFYIEIYNSAFWCWGGNPSLSSKMIQAQQLIHHSIMIPLSIH